MGFPKQHHFPAGWAPVVSEPTRHAQPRPASPTGAPRWRPRKLHLAAGAVGAYLALGAILTADLSPDALLAVADWSASQAEPPQAKPRDEQDPLAVERMAIAHDMRFLMADPGRETAVEAPGQIPAVAAAFPAVPRLPGAAAVAEPAVDGLPPPRPAALHAVPMPGRPMAESLALHFPATMGPVALPVASALAAPASPEAAPPGDVAPPVPMLAWPPGIAGATDWPMPLPSPAASVARAQSRTALVFFGFGRTAARPGPVVVRAGGLSPGGEDPILWPATRDGDGAVGCGASVCLSAIPLALGVEAAPPATAAAARRGGTLSTAGTAMASLDGRGVSANIGSATRAFGAAPGRGTQAKSGRRGASSDATGTPGRGGSRDGSAGPGRGTGGGPGHGGGGRGGGRGDDGGGDGRGKSGGHGGGHGKGGGHGGGDGGGKGGGGGGKGGGRDK